MNILLLQTDIAWQSPERNRLRAGELVTAHFMTDASMDAPRLIVLPEMFTTGFVTEPEGVAERGGETLEWMRSLARQADSAVGGSVAIEEEGGYYNRFYFVKPDGSFAHYDKRHLFSYAGEHKRYTPGSQRVVVEWGGFRILLQVCYDLRFPVFARNRGDYDMIIYVADWPASRINAWDILLKARAVENACYVVGVNRTGNDPSQVYCGSSAVIDYKGNVVADAGSGEAAVVTRVEMEPLAAFREKFPVLGDADAFTLG